MDTWLHFIYSSVCLVFVIPFCVIVVSTLWSHLTALLRFYFRFCSDKKTYSSNAGLSPGTEKSTSTRRLRSHHDPQLASSLTLRHRQQTCDWSFPQIHPNVSTSYRWFSEETLNQSDRRPVTETRTQTSDQCSNKVYQELIGWWFHTDQDVSRHMCKVFWHVWNSQHLTSSTLGFISLLSSLTGDWMPLGVESKFHTWPGWGDQL